MAVSKERQAVLDRIAEYEKAGRFNDPVEIDPPAPELLPDGVDYLRKKFSTKVKKWLANFIADRYFLNFIKKDIMVIDGVTGTEHLEALQKGAVVTCNHFSPFDNYIAFHAIRKYLPKKYLYKVIREGNYTNFPGLYGFFFKYCNTLPLSRNRRTMMHFTSAVNTLLKEGNAVLIYPEQEMWWNYKKPRPFKVGAFKMAYKANVPIVPIFISMKDDGSRLDGDGYPLQRHTVHILPPVYPEPGQGERLGAEKMMQEAFALYEAKYREVYEVGE